MADLEKQVMQLTQDLYVLKHTVIAGKTVEERIKESNTVPEDAMIKEEENRKLKERIDELEKCNLNLQERLDRKEEVNKSYRKEIKDHQLYEEKLEHRIIEFEELLHGE